MTLEEARGRLMKAAQYMNSDQAIREAVAATDMREQLRTIMSQHADKPVIVQRLLQALLDEVITDQIPGYDNPLVKLLCKTLRDSLESVAFLAAEGFEEGAWFRASDALVAMGVYLDAVEVAGHFVAETADA